MLTLTSIIIGMCIALLIGLWWNTLQIREQAEHIVKQRCRQDNLQLLDGTVALKKLRLHKNNRGDIALLRYFGFEFSTTGQDRRHGTIVLSGLITHYIYMDLPESPVLTVKPESTQDDPPLV